MVLSTLEALSGISLQQLVSSSLHCPVNPTLHRSTAVLHYTKGSWEVVALFFQLGRVVEASNSNVIIMGTIEPVPWLAEQA